jgi:protein phosphatase 2C family protein 2/3
MEDAHAAVLSIDERVENPNAFFAVYDGHGGGSVAKFAGINVHKRLVTEESYREKRYEEALKRAFLGTDEDLLADPGHARDPSGCTAVAALVTGDGKIYVANAGDSRSVLSVKGEVEPLSFDHKPSNETERTRISGAGGYIEYGRVNGNLALSRALGDFEFKKNTSLIAEKQVITADPDVTVHDITEEDEFMVIACDGIWDCLSSQQVVSFVRLKVFEGHKLGEIGEMLCDHCLAPDTSSGAGIGCDNMTVLIVAILNGRTTEEWYSWMSDRVRQNYGYSTPRTLPQIYAQNRLNAFKARREAQEERERLRAEREAEREASNSGVSSSSTGGTTFSRILGSTGGISFHPGSEVMSDTGNLMFGTDDSDDDDESGDEMAIESGGSSFFSLKARLDEYEKGIGFDADKEDDTFGMEGLQNSSDRQETPPPKSQPNGDVIPVEQLKSEPEGDAPSAAVKAEGLLDGSEDPLKM